MMCSKLPCKLSSQRCLSRDVVQAGMLGQLASLRKRSVAGLGSGRTGQVLLPPVCQMPWRGALFVRRLSARGDRAAELRGKV